jgi:hypothetical protein
MLRNGGQQFAGRIRCDRRFAASQPASAQRALDGVSALVRRGNGVLESELHDSSLPAPSIDGGRRPSRYV